VLLGVLGVLVWGSNVFAAPPGPRVSGANQRVGRDWSLAEAHRRAGRHKQCGEIFERLVKALPKHPRADAMLFNAAVCYEQGGEVWHAIRARKGLVKRFPRSRFAPVAMRNLAANYHKVLKLADAAGWHERYAFRYPKRKDARESLMRAIALRGGLRQKLRMRGNVRRFIVRYGYHYPALGARVFWQWVAYARDHGKAAEYETALGHYFRRHARRGSVDRMIEALVELGRIQWRRSCRIPADEGVCRRVRLVKKRGSSKRRRVVRYLARKPIPVATAARYFNRALKVWANGRALGKISTYAPDRVARRQNARRFAALATFMKAELQLESYLKSAPPRIAKARADPLLASRSLGRATKWMHGKMKTGARLVKSYLRVITGVRARVGGKQRGDPQWSIAALYRSGSIFRNFARQVQGAGVPKSWGAAPRSKALGAFKICVALAKKLGWHDLWERRCRRALHELNPTSYPRPKGR